jgi:hypothetical protein
MHKGDAPDFIKTVAKFRGFQAGVPYAGAFVSKTCIPWDLPEGYFLKSPDLCSIKIFIIL